MVTSDGKTSHVRANASGYGKKKKPLELLQKNQIGNLP